MYIRMLYMHMYMTEYAYICMYQRKKFPNVEEKLREMRIPLLYQEYGTMILETTEAAKALKMDRVQ